MSFVQNGTTYTTVSGSRSTSNIGASAAQRDVDKATVILKPFQTPILTRMLNTKLGKRPTGNQKFEFSVTTLLPTSGTITLTGGAATEVVVAANLGDITLFQVGTMVLVDNTGDELIASTVTGTTSVTFTKVGAGNIAAAAAKNYKFLAPTYEQGSPSATAKSVNKNFVYNYTQIIKASIHATGSQEATLEYGDNDWMLKKETGLESLKNSWEYSLLFGKGRAFATGFQVGSNSQYTTGGAFYGNVDTVPFQYINAVDTTVTGSFTEEYFFKTFLKNAYVQGSQLKRFYVGGGLKSLISGFSRANLHTFVGEKEYGVDITKITHDYGVLEIAWHPMLNGAIHTNWGLMLDINSDYLSCRYLSANGKSRDLAFQEFPFLEEEDQRKGQWLIECGWEIKGDDYHYKYMPAS